MYWNLTKINFNICKKKKICLIQVKFITLSFKYGVYITYCQDLAASSPQNHRNRPCTQSQAVLWRDCLTGQPARNQRIQRGGMELSECGTKTTTILVEIMET